MIDSLFILIGPKGKKRKAEDDDPNPDDPSAPKKKKPATKVTKGRFKGPVDFDKQCGVINDKGLNCSRSLTCKSHSMGAKRAVEGRSKPYDELLLEWNRLNNPNFVEPVKRESKAEKKAKKDKEKAEKKICKGESCKRLTWWWPNSKWYLERRLKNGCWNSSAATK